MERLRSKSVLITCRATVLIVACFVQHERPSKAANEKPRASASQAPFNLTLHGYNYTDRDIDDYSVNGTSGGNLSVSGPGSVGGGSICCITYYRGARNLRVKVKWQVDACLYIERSTISSEDIESIRSVYKEADVNVESITADDPHYFEVHFYPDGHVEASITAVESRPRLDLDENRENKAKFPKCANNQKPPQ